MVVNMKYVTLLRIFKQATFSRKKKKHTYTVMIAISPEGHIYFISLSYPGSKNDFNIYNIPENHIH